MHSEITDVLVVKGGLCKLMASFAFGTTTLLRKLSEVTNQNLESSGSILTLYQGEKLDEHEKSNVKRIVDPLLSAWSESFIKSLTDSFDIMHIPRTVLLSAHSHFDIFKESLLFRTDLNFDILSHESITSDDQVIFEKGAAQSEMVKLYTLALGAMI